MLRSRSLAVLVTGVIVSAALVSVGAGSAGATPVADPGTAQLQGTFLLAGQITLARGVFGERRGQTFLRAWTFQPGCSTGGCDAIGLIRQRAGGTDRLLLIRRAPGVYSVTARYYAPLRCGRRTYRTGQGIVFTITLTITTAAVISGANMATGISATYASIARINTTRCVGVPGYDAAVYQGQPLSAPGQL